MTAIAMAEQERRQTVTVLFIDIVGFTSLVDELDCAVVRALQRDYFSTVSEVVRAGGGVRGCTAWAGGGAAAAAPAADGWSDMGWSPLEAGSAGAVAC